MANRLDLPVPFDVQELSDRIAAQRGRPIFLRSATLPPDSPSGLCVSAETADFIFYEARTTALHQDHIVLHEIGHLLWGHDVSVAVAEETFAQVLPALDPRTVRCMLGRGDCTGVTEQQAELVATLIMRRVIRRPPSPAPSLSRDDAETIARLSRTLEKPGVTHG